MANEDLLQKEIEETINQVKQVKNYAKNMKRRRQALSSQPVARHGESLEHNLKKILPEHLMPKNVGHLHDVAWPFWYQLDFDLTTTSDWPNLTSNTRLTSQFQVSQEAGFLIMGLSRHANDYNNAGDLGMLQIEIRDRQSSRFFNDAPIPIQMIGQKAEITVMPTPFLVLPNAFVEMTLSTHIASGVTISTPVGSSGLHQFTFHGYRVRIEQAHKVLSHIFG